MKAILLPALAVLALLPVLGMAQTAPVLQKHPQRPAPDIAPVDRTFVLKAVDGNMADIDFSQLAPQNGLSEAVKDFAKQIVQDHNMAQAKLTLLASQDDIHVPTGPEKAHQIAAQRLGKLHGAAFDREYLTLMAKNHATAIALLTHEIAAGKDADIVRWAKATLPVVRRQDEVLHTLATTAG